MEVNVVEGPEEYLPGEERALLEVIEGNDPPDQASEAHGAQVPPAHEDRAPRARRA